MTTYGSFSLEQDYPHTVAEVYAAWTEAPLMAQWFWGSMGKNVEATCDARPGGFWSVYTDYRGDPDWTKDRAGMLGFFALVDPRQQLVYTVHWDANVVYNLGKTDCPDELIRVHFDSNGPGCRIRYTHEGFPDDGHSEKGHRDGTLDCLQQLGKILDAQI